MPVSVPVLALRREHDHPSTSERELAAPFTRAGDASERELGAQAEAVELESTRVRGQRFGCTAQARLQITGTETAWARKRARKWARKRARETGSAASRGQGHRHVHGHVAGGGVEGTRMGGAATARASSNRRATARAHDA